MQRYRPGNRTREEDVLSADAEGEVESDVESTSPPWSTRVDVVLVGVAFFVLVAMIVLAATK